MWKGLALFNVFDVLSVDDLKDSNSDFSEAENDVISESRNKYKSTLKTELSLHSLPIFGPFIARFASAQ